MEGECGGGGGGGMGREEDEWRGEGEWGEWGRLDTTILRW